MSWGPFDLTGKGICVTGGGGHLGASITKILADAGATVLIIGRNKSSLDQVVENCKSARGNVICMVGDISRDETITDAFLKLKVTSDGLTGLVNNAHSQNESRGFQFSQRDVSEISQSLISTMNCTKLIAERMIADGTKGSIVNISSIYGLVSPDPLMYADNPEMHNPAAYGAVKAGILQFSRFAAVHLAPNQIRVNSVTPGAFPNLDTQKNQKFIDKLTVKIPLGRIGLADEIGGAIVYLMSSASNYVTGSNLIVDGGWTAV